MTSTSPDAARSDALDYALAHTLEEAIAAAGAGASPLAGGTLIVPAVAHQGLTGSYVDISRLDALRAIREEGGWLHIGALVRHADLEAAAGVAALYPALVAAARSIGNPQVRAAGTVGGNVACRLARASLPAALLALDAEVVIAGRGGAGPRPLAALLETGVPPGSILTEVRIPPPGGRRAAYVKFAWRHTSAKAIAAVAVSLELDGGRAKDPHVVASALCIARRLPKAEAMLRGRTLDDATIDEVARVAAAEPPYEVDPDAVPIGEPYRRRLVAHGVTQLLREVRRA